MMKNILFFLCLMGSSGFAQLPEDWQGTYEGELTSTDLNGLQISYKMGLTIQTKTDTTYDFILVYGEDSLRQERKYELYNNGANKFVLDEKNGVLLDMSLGFGKLTSVFDVQGSLLHVSYIKTKKGMRYELSSSKQAFKTGDTNFEGEQIPEIISYKTTSFQEAILKKQK
jgi:hypothetical protein